MKTAASNAAHRRLAWIACAALALSACTGPGLEPPQNDSRGGMHGGKQSDAGTSQHGNADMGAGSGGQTSVPGSTTTGTGGSHGSSGGSGGNGGAAGENNPPVIKQDAGSPLMPGTGEEDAGQDP